VIAYAARTGRGFSFSGLRIPPPMILGAAVSKRWLSARGVDKADVSETILGSVADGGQAQTLPSGAYQCRGLAPEEVAVEAINRVAGQAFVPWALAASIIQLGDGEIYRVRWAVRKMSMSPHSPNLRPGRRWARYEIRRPIDQRRLLWDAFNKTTTWVKTVRQRCKKWPGSAARMAGRVRRCLAENKGRSAPEAVKIADEIAAFSVQTARAKYR